MRLSMHTIASTIKYLVFLSMLPLTLPAQTNDSLTSLKISSAVYQLEPGILEFSFTFINPTDRVVFLDCQVPPKFSLEGQNLILTLDRTLPSGAPSENLEAFMPQRIGAKQTFQATRRFDHILGEATRRPHFSTVQLGIAYYPERSEGEGLPYLVERAVLVQSKKQPALRQGKPPLPPKKVKIVHPVDP